MNIEKSDISSMFRVGKKDTNNVPRPLLVKFRERAMKNEVMESLSELKDAEQSFKTLSITHDLTKKEREECKKLVDEAKKRESDQTKDVQSGQGEFIFRVRGPPGQMRIIRFRKQ